MYVAVTGTLHILSCRKSNCVISLTNACTCVAFVCHCFRQVTLKVTGTDLTCIKWQKVPVLLQRKNFSTWWKVYCFADLLYFCIVTLLLLLLLLLPPINSLLTRTAWVSWYQNGKSSLDLNEARDDGALEGIGISWSTCKRSAPRCRQITTPNTSSLNSYRWDALPDA